MSLNELAKTIHEQAIAAGFYDERRRLPEHITLAHSELSEAYDAWRDDPLTPHISHNRKSPEGWAVELIDCIIVCLDILADHEIDVETLLYQKMQYNLTRPRLHGRGI